ncbi:NHL repeat-containing protein 3-like [Antedon mediterranea]|uniref:NHL repeat-containing protein 3-like n=1 Tax=Antedon mediterranea TaxID=105859 RepID=UPI003AF84999
MESSTVTMSLCLLFTFCCLFLISSAAPQKALYKLDDSWPLNTSVFTGQVYSVDIDEKAGEIYVSQRGVKFHPIVVFSEDGHLKRVLTFDTSVVSMIHGLRVFQNVTSGQTSVWVTDLGNATYGHTVKGFSPEGKLETMIGTAGTAGTGLAPVQFDHVADLAFNEKGEMYIVDGDGGSNNRLIKLSKDFKLMWHVGGPNSTKDGYFDVPHSVELDEHNRVWVADRMNGRLQAFDADTGKFLGKWTSCFSTGQPYSVRISKDKTHFIVALLNESKILLVATPPNAGAIGECVVLDTITLPQNTAPHLVGVNNKSGVFYVAELKTHTCQKFVPIERKKNKIYNDL